MAIVRAPRMPGNFTVISNTVLLDSRLSMRALGLLVRLLARPDNWRTNSETLAREFDCGRDQMRSTLKELSDSGYVRLVTLWDESGRISSEWHVFDESSDQTSPGPEKPYAGSPGPEKPASGESGPLTKTDLTSTDNKCPPVGFAVFWSTWPSGQRKGGKADCLKIWKAKKLEKHSSEIVEHVKTMIESSDWKKEGGAYIPLPATYLRQCRWDGAEATSPSRQNRFAGAI